MRVGGERNTAVVLGVLTVLSVIVVGAGVQLSTATEAAQTTETSSKVGFAYVNDGDLTLATRDGNEINLGVSANVIGAGKDADGDGYVEIPYVTSNSNLKIIDKTGEKQTLATDADKTKTKVAIGDHDADQEDSVYYTQDGVLKAANIVDNSTQTLEEADTSIAAVAGVGDITGDDTPEVVYTDGSNIGYYNESGVNNNFYSSNVGQNNGAGIGAPRDFNNDGTSRIPIVTGSNNVALVNGSGSSETLMESSSAEKSPVAAVDWTGGSDLEVLFVHSNQNAPYYVTLNESVEPIDAVSGTADTEAGIARVADAPLVLSNFTLANESGTLQASFNSSSDLRSLDITIDGPDSESLTLADFNDTTTDGRYTYTGNYTPNTAGNYTATLNSATATDGDTASSEHRDTATIETEFNVTDLNATANGFDLNISFNATEQLSAVTVDIAGQENDTLGLDTFEPTSSESPYVYTGTYTANTTGEYNITLTQATADGDQLDKNLTAAAIADEPLNVSNFTLVNETDGIHVAFNASEQLDETTVAIDGPTNTTLDDSDFTETETSDGYAYKTTHETTEVGTYNGTLERAASTDGDVVTPALTANATIGNPFDVTNLTATARNGALNLSFETTHTLDTVTVEIAGAETDTLRLGNFSTNDSSPTYTYTGRYAANTTGDYEVTLSDATAVDGQTNDDTPTATAGIEALLANATLTDATDQNAIVNESDRVTITAEVSSAADTVTADASAFGAGTVSLEPTGTTYQETIDVAVRNVTEPRRVPVSVTGVSGRHARDTTNTILIDTEPPTVDVGENRTVDAGANVTLSPASADDATTRIVTSSWTVDGTQQGGETITTAFEEAGTYPVRLAVTDAAGNVNTDQLTVTVNATGSTTEAPADAPSGGSAGGGAGGGSILSTPTATTTSDAPTTPESPQTTQPATTTTDSVATTTRTTQDQTETLTNTTTNRETRGGAATSVEMPFGQLFGIPTSTTVLAVITAALVAVRRSDEP